MCCKKATRRARRGTPDKGQERKKRKGGQKNSDEMSTSQRVCGSGSSSSRTPTVTNLVRSR
jgi:hypothetical protein